MVLVPRSNFLAVPAYSKAELQALKIGLNIVKICCKLKWQAVSKLFQISSTAEHLKIFLIGLPCRELANSYYSRLYKTHQF